MNKINKQQINKQQASKDVATQKQFEQFSNSSSLKDYLSASGIHR